MRRPQHTPASTRTTPRRTRPALHRPVRACSHRSNASRPSARQEASRQRRGTRCRGSIPPRCTSSSMCKTQPTIDHTAARERKSVRATSSTLRLRCSPATTLQSHTPRPRSRHEPTSLHVWVLPHRPARSAGPFAQHTRTRSGRAHDPSRGVTRFYPRSRIATRAESTRRPIRYQYRNTSFSNTTPGARRSLAPCTRSARAE
jgi:hypothetical protein